MADRFAGLASIYDAARPALPDAAVDAVVTALGRSPREVVDVGCGTGLSSFPWARVAANVRGFDPSPDMVAIAAARSTPHVTFARARADALPVAAGDADIVSCAQAFHWLDPSTALPEAVRILAPGGVFATIDYDWPPRMDPALEAAFTAVRTLVAEWELSTGSAPTRRAKRDRMAVLRSSGLFRDVRECEVTSVVPAPAERVMAMLESQSGVAAMRRSPNAAARAQLAERLEGVQVAAEADRTRSVAFTFRVRLGIRA